MNDRYGDPSYRALNREEPFYDFQITHDYYDHSDARKDPHILFLFGPLCEMVEEGVLRNLAQTDYAFMGHIDGRRIATLVAKAIREVAAKLKADQVNLVHLTPEGLSALAYRSSAVRAQSDRKAARYDYRFVPLLVTERE